MDFKLQCWGRVVVFVIRYAIRSAKSRHPAVGQSLDRLVQRWPAGGRFQCSRYYYLSVLGFVPKYLNKKIKKTNFFYIIFDFLLMGGTFNAYSTW